MGTDIYVNYGTRRLCFVQEFFIEKVYRLELYNETGIEEALIFLEEEKYKEYLIKNEFYLLVTKNYMMNESERENYYKTIFTQRKEEKPMSNTVNGTCSATLNSIFKTCSDACWVTFKPKNQKKYIESILINKEKRITTVVFGDGDVQMSKCHPEDEFNPEIAVSLCIARHEFKSRTKLLKFVEKNAKVIIKKPTKKNTKKGK